MLNKSFSFSPQLVKVWLLVLAFHLAVSALSAGTYGISAVESAFPETNLCGVAGGGGIVGTGGEVATTSVTLAPLTAACNGSTAGATGSINFANLQGSVYETNSGSSTFSANWYDSFTVNGSP